MTPKNILVIEDEPSVTIALRDSLESEGYAVQTVADGGEGFSIASSPEKQTAKPDLIILDLMLPKMNGLEICQRLRSAGVETPILMLTARGAASDAAFGLKLGADDYMPKPFDVGELLARVEAILRRANRQQIKESISIGDVELDLRRLKATKKGQPLDLSPREFEILQILIAHAGETVTREQMLHHIWGEHASLYTRTIDAHITRLRQKLEINPSNPQHIITVHRLGYRLVAA